MGKKSDIEKLTNLMSRALRHKIGSIVNENELYAEKYAKDAEIILKEAEKVINMHGWNNYEKEKIKQILKMKLKKELEEKEFLDNRKFEIMDKEINKVLDDFGLS